MDCNNAYIHSRIRFEAASPALIEQWQQTIDWDKTGGMLPVIVQDTLTLQVLMQGFMNLEALQQSLSIGKVTFYSRSKQRLWCKGETSGNFLLICELALDCDCDSLLVLAHSCGPTCHKGSNSCYSSLQDWDENQATTNTSELQRLGSGFAVSESLGLGWLGTMERIIQQRIAQQFSTEGKKTPGHSYIKYLFECGIQRMAQKVGEEGVEVALAAMALQAASEQQHSSFCAELSGEAADLLFHLSVLLQACGVSFQDAIDVLEQRHRKALTAEPVAQ